MVLSGISLEISKKLKRKNRLSKKMFQNTDLKQAFTMFDKNGDNKISPDELHQAMKYLGLSPSEKEVKQMIEVVDTNCNGYVDYDEFYQMMTNTKIEPKNDDDELRETFLAFDLNRDGFISAEEIKKTMAYLGENLTDEEVNQMIKSADKNGDGRVDINGKLNTNFFIKHRSF
jgi:calmodulin